jgi:hypothetical protein
MTVMLDVEEVKTDGMEAGYSCPVGKCICTGINISRT